MAIHRRRIALFLLLVSVLVLAACGSATETPGSATETPAIPTATAEPAAGPPATASATAPASGVEEALKHIQRFEGATLAIVNGEEITWEDYEPTLRQALFSINQQNAVDWTDPAMQARLAYVQEDVLKQMVDRWLLRQMAAAQGILVSEADLEAEVESEKADILGSRGYPDWSTFLEMNGLTEKSFRQMISDTLLLNAFLAAQDVERQAEQVHLAHIALGDEATAQEVLTKLKAGEDFAALAAQYSLDPNSKDKGGDLGWFTEEMMEPQVAKVAFSLEPGQFSDPIGTGQGYSLLLVLERGVHELEPQVLQLRQQQAVLGQIEAERAKAKIEYLVDFVSQ